MQEMVYLKAIQKSAPMGVSVSGTTDLKTYLKKFRGASAPLAPRGSAYETVTENFNAVTRQNDGNVAAKI